MEQELEQKKEQCTRIPPDPNYWKRTLYLWGPFLIKGLIGFIISGIAVFLYVMIYASGHAEELLAIVESQELMADFSIVVTEEILRYSTQIEGITAIVTIPILMIMFYRDKQKEKRYGLIQNNKAPISKYIWSVMLAVAMSIGLNNLILIANLTKIDEQYNGTAEALYSAPLGMQILCLCILVPIAEELVFRGLLFKRLRQSVGFLQAAIYSAIVFGLFHGNMVQMLYGIIAGMMLAYVYEKNGSFTVPVLCHICMNLVSVLFTYMGGFEWMINEFVRVAAVTICCGTVAATMFVIIQRIEERPEQLIS